jgi:hypothetical protein
VIVLGVERAPEIGESYFFGPKMWPLTDHIEPLERKQSLRLPSSNFRSTDPMRESEDRV